MDDNNNNTNDAQAAATPPGEGAAGGPADDVKIDPVTALQDGIDGLSLAMFEALRGLRDAVAPESGNLGSNNNANPPPPTNPDDNPNDNNNNTQQQQPDADELWQAYQMGDPEVKQLLDSVVSKYNLNWNNNNNTKRYTRDKVIQIHAQLEQSRDTELVQELAQTVLDKSAWIDQTVTTNYGTARTRPQQMERIQALMQQNAAAAQQLQALHQRARHKQDECRRFVREQTCRALDIHNVEDDYPNSAAATAAVKSEEPASPVAMDTSS